MSEIISLFVFLFFIGLLFIPVIIVVILVVMESNRKKRKKLQPAAGVDAAPRPAADYRQAIPGGNVNPYSSSIAPTQDGGWVLNHDSTFLLTIYGIDQATAAELKRLLIEGYALGPEACAETFVSIVTRTNLRCKEIDDYVRLYKPLYLGKLEELKRSSTEWSTATGKDKEELLEEFREKALGSLDVIPYGGVETLFEDEPADATIDDAMVERYGFENMYLYLRHSGKLDKVKIITRNDRDHKGFEKLVEMGLASRGKDIPLPAVLEALRLKDMNAMIADIDRKPFRRKSEGIEFLKNLPDVLKRIGKVVAFRNLFQLKPLPDEFSKVDFEQVASAWDYAGVISELIAHTYYMGEVEKQNRIQYQQILSSVTGWKIMPVNDEVTCQYCKRCAGTTYPAVQCPSVPLHIGCRCTIQPLFKR